MDHKIFLLWWFLLQISFHGDICHALRPKSSKLITCNNLCSAVKGDKNVTKLPCSCSQSCTVYGDCCYDSPWKNADTRKDLFCLPVRDFGDVALVSTCPHTSLHGQISACDQGLNFGLPVTSLDTGISYLNSECALCNKDTDNLKTWPVKLVCCNEYNIKASSFLYLYQRKLWSLSVMENGTRSFCECAVFLDQAETHSMDNLETRNCQRKEVSTCSFTWKDESVKRYCASYLDPVYKRDKIYRNKFCAACNYERDDQLTCTPKYQDILSSYGLSNEEGFIGYCNTNGMDACLKLLMRTRGWEYSLDKLFSMEVQACIPPEGRFCCKGERYDFKFMKCRKVFSRKGW